MKTRRRGGRPRPRWYPASMLITRRWFLVALTSVMVVAPATAGAAPMTPYSKASFVDAQNAGKPIVVFVHASW